jgi:Cu2+-containing amine oxidase
MVIRAIFLKYNCLKKNIILFSTTFISVGNKICIDDKSMVSVMRNTSGGYLENEECSKSKLSLCYLEKKTNNDYQHWEKEIADIKSIIDTLEQKVNLLNAKLNKERYRRKSFIDEHKFTKHVEEENEQNGNNHKQFLHIIFHTVLFIYFFAKKN